MKMVSDIMSGKPVMIAAEAPLSEAARLMKFHDIGSLPVCKDATLLGIVTDRDIVIRGLADKELIQGLHVSDVMTAENLVTVKRDTSLEEAAKKMEEAQIRRLAVLDDKGKLTGMVALSDFALKAVGHLDEEILEGVSKAQCAVVTT